MRCCIRKGIQLAAGADLIHTTTYNAAIPASLIARRTKKKLMITVHEIFGKLRYRFVGRKGFFYERFERIIFRFHFDKYRCVSNYTKNSLRIAFGLPDTKIKTIYLGIDNELWNRSNFPQEKSQALREQYLGAWGKYLGLFFGRPGISKGLPFFLLALPEIIQTIPHFKALLMLSKDDPSRFEYIHSIISKYHLQSHVAIIPSVPYKEIGNYLLASDVVVVPSLAEGFGFAAAEVCALSQQLVVTSTAALPEVVSGRVNFVEPSNPREIARAVIDFEQGRYETIPPKSFKRDDTVDRVVALYNELLESSLEFKSIPWKIS
jgi:glycosyltransferase involved in cell wall biosynthesis